MPPTDNAKSTWTTDYRPRIYLDAPVAPNNSLSRRGMVVVLCLIAAFNVLTAIFMFVIGAFPAPIFLGADMAAVTLAFYLIDRRRQRRTERILVSTDKVEVFRMQGGREASVWTTAPSFTRVVLDGADQDLPLLTLTSSGKTLPVGEELGGEGRKQLAADIEAAISAAKAERYSP